MTQGSNEKLDQFFVVQVSESQGYHMSDTAWDGAFAIKSKYINMPVEGGQGKTIILHKDLVNKSYAASSCIN